MVIHKNWFWGRSGFRFVSNYTCPLACGSTNDISAGVWLKLDWVASLVCTRGCVYCVCVCVYLCVVCTILRSYVWIKSFWFNMVPTELLIPVTPPPRGDLGFRLILGLPVHPLLFLLSPCPWTAPCRFLSLPVSFTICQT